MTLFNRTSVVVVTVFVLPYDGQNGMEPETDVTGNKEKQLLQK